MQETPGPRVELNATYASILNSISTVLGKMGCCRSGMYLNVCPPYFRAEMYAGRGVR